MKSFAAEMLPFQSREMRLGNFMLRYLDEGPGVEAGVESVGGASGEAGSEASDEKPSDRAAADETILCVHGNPTWSFYWRSVVQRFSNRCRVIAVDHLGCGRSDKPTRAEFPYTLESHIDNLVALIDSLDLKRITLVAHDWGGAIGTGAMLKRLDRCERIVLMNTAAFPPPYVPLRIAACRIPILGTAAIRGLNLFARAAVTMAMSRNKMSREVAEGLLAPYDSWANRIAIDCFVRDIPLTKAHPTHATLERIESELPRLADRPSCLVWGMKDWCFRPECMQRLQQVWPNANSVPIADGGHYIMEDAPQEVLEAIEKTMALPTSMSAANDGRDESRERNTSETNAR